jgi:oxygen-independent coproporphyrinogen-3 oxidase
MARAAGFDNISLDLMMWLPQQTVSGWLESVDALVALGPDHASMYLLELYPNAPLRDAMARGQWSQAPDDDAADMYLSGLDRMDRAGYVQYEISNVARPGRQSRHNLKYWTGGEWIGLGCGAHSTRAGVRWRNVSATEEYISRVSGGGTAACDRRALSADERLEEALFMGLRLSSGVDLEALKSRHGVDVWDRFWEELRPFADAGVLHYDGRSVRMTREGMLVANEVMAVFIGPRVR